MYVWLKDDQFSYRKTLIGLNTVVSAAHVYFMESLNHAMC